MNVLRKVGSDTGNLLGACDFFHQYWQNARLSSGLAELLKNKISVKMANFNPLHTRIVGTNRHTEITHIRQPVQPFR
jgi:hypothetical protein